MAQGMSIMYSLIHSFIETLSTYSRGKGHVAVNAKPNFYLHIQFYLSMCTSQCLRFYYVSQRCACDQVSAVPWTAPRYNSEHSAVTLVLLKERLVSQENKVPTQHLNFRVNC